MYLSSFTVDTPILHREQYFIYSVHCMCGDIPVSPVIAVLPVGPTAPYFEKCISEQDLDEVHIEIIRNTLYKVQLPLVLCVYWYNM